MQTYLHKLLLLFMLNSPAFFFHNGAEDDFFQKNNDSLSIVFYNAENFFDYENDPRTRDDEFTPTGSKHWTKKRFDKKNKMLVQAILSSAGWIYPAVIGLCEIENNFVLDRLLHDTPLKNHTYKYIHEDSPDQRGIDVAFIYDSLLIKPLYTKSIEVPLEDKDKTRDILYVKTAVWSDTIHFFVNHWPSRYQGYLKTEKKRLKASAALLKVCDSILNINIHANIVIMGDFNDEPHNRSIQNIVNFSKNTEENIFINLMGGNPGNLGTVKYKELWYLFDQFIVSTALCKEHLRIKLKKKPAISPPQFLMLKDTQYLGVKPYRTYLGYNYTGGYSDHFPIVLVLIMDKN